MEPFFTGDENNFWLLFSRFHNVFIYYLLVHGYKIKNLTRIDFVSTRNFNKIAISYILSNVIIISPTPLVVTQFNFQNTHDESSTTISKFKHLRNG